LTFSLLCFKIKNQLFPNHILRGGKKMIRQRWIWPLCAIGLLYLAYLKGECREIGIAFAIGMIIGFFIDFIGIKWLRYWTYTRYRFLGVKYFTIVIPCWGIFGALVNSLWGLMDSLQPWLVFLVLTVALLIFWEALNLITRTWKYNTPVWLVMTGWFPLIFFLRVLFITLS